MTTSAAATICPETDTVAARRARARAAIGIEELLVWAYQRQRVLEAGFAASVRPPGWDGCDSIVRLTRGPVTGGRAFGHFGQRVHPDAEAVSAAVGQDGLVIRCARTATRPDWGDREPLRVVVPWPKPKYIYALPRHVPIACEVKYEGVPEEALAPLRDEYRRWWHRLHGLRGALANQLTAFELTDALPPAAPWIA